MKRHRPSSCRGFALIEGDVSEALELEIDDPGVGAGYNVDVRREVGAGPALFLEGGAADLDAGSVPGVSCGV